MQDIMSQRTDRVVSTDLNETENDTNNLSVIAEIDHGQ